MSEEELCSFSQYLECGEGDDFWYDLQESYLLPAGEQGPLKKPIKARRSSKHSEKGLRIENC